MATAQDKPRAVGIENSSTFDEDGHFNKTAAKEQKVDYSGAHEKTDPKEIALVRKLDRRIMVRVSNPDSGRILPRS